MEMELHPLLRGGVFPEGLLAHHHGVRFQNHIIGIPVNVQPALYQEMLPLFDAVHQWLSFLAQKKFTHPDRAGIVGHVKGHHPRAPLFQLPVVDGEHVALHDDGAHVQLQRLHGGGLPFDLPAAKEQLLLSPGLGRRR